MTAYLYRCLATLLALALLAGCMGGDDPDPTTTPEPTDPPATATSAPAEAPAASPTLPADPLATAVHFDTPPSPGPFATPFPNAGAPYQPAGTIGVPTIPRAPADVDVIIEQDFERLVVADAGRREIQIFSGEQELIASWPVIVRNPFNDSVAPFPPEHVVAAQGSFYVGLAESGGIARFSAEGELLGQFTFRHPSTTLFDLALGLDGRLYAAVGSFRTGGADDADPFGLYIFDGGLNLLEIREAGPPLLPMAIAVDGEGLLHILLVHTGAGSASANSAQPARIAVFDPSMDREAELDASLEFDLEGRFDGLVVTSDGNYLLIEEASSDSRDVAGTTGLIITPDGEELDRWQIDGHAASPLRDSAGMALIPDSRPDAGDRLMLADPLGQRILALDLEGEILFEWRDDPGHLAAPSGIALLPGGELAVLDVPSREIAIFTPGSAEPERFPIDIQTIHPTLGAYGRLFAGSEGSVWYVDSQEASPFALHRLDLETGEIRQFEPQPGDAEPGFIFSPATGAVGPDGQLYLALHDGTVQTYGPDGELQETWPAGDDHPVEEIVDIAAGLDGVYVLWRQMGVESYVTRVGDDPEGSPVQLVAPDVSTSAPDPVRGLPAALAVGEDGLFYLLEAPGDSIIVVDGSGELVSRWSIPAAEYPSPFDIAVDTDGRVYISDVRQGQVLIYAPEE